MQAGITVAKDERNVIRARKKYQVELPNGNMVWFTGETISEAINNGLKKYAFAYFDGVQPASSLPTFKRYAEKWFPLYHVPKVKPNTANNTRIILQRHIYPALGGMRLDEITPDEIQAFFNTKMHMCRSTMQKMKIVIHQVFQSAIEDGYVQRNPASSSRLTISKRATGRTALPLTDVEDIVRQLPTLNETDRLFLLLPIYTGMRRSEMLGLRWSDVDFRLKQIRVQRGVTFAGNQPVIGPPKSKAGYRFIPLLPELDAALRAYEHEGEYIIGGDRPITEQSYQRTWERINRTINLHGATPMFSGIHLQRLLHPTLMSRPFRPLWGTRILRQLWTGIHTRRKKESERQENFSRVSSNQAIPDMNPDTMKSPQNVQSIGFAGNFFLRFLTFFLTKCTEK